MSYSENASHRAALQAAELTRQASSPPGASQATVKAADIAYYRACVTSALANGVTPQQFMTALRELGTGGGLTRGKRK
jgi:hypothetical protein